MDWLQDISGILTGVLSIALIVGGGWAAMQLGTSKYQKDHIDALEKRVERLEKDGAEKDATIVRQAADLDALARVVTGETHWVALGEQLDAHHSEANDHWTLTTSTLNEILAVLRGVQGA